MQKFLDNIHYATSDSGDASCDGALECDDSLGEPSSQNIQLALVQVQTENFWHSFTHAFSDAGKWIGHAAKDTEKWVGHAAKDVGNAVVGATVALGTEKFWKSLGNTAVDAAEDGLAEVAAIGAL